MKELKHIGHTVKTPVKIEEHNGEYSVLDADESFLLFTPYDDVAHFVMECFNTIKQEEP